MTNVSRFGEESIASIKEVIIDSVPENTRKSHASVWNQFELFCADRNYLFEADTPLEKLNQILIDWGYNMKKADGSDYKESVVKTMWNVTAKLIREKYFNEFKRNVNPFSDIEFKLAIDARNSKRQLLQTDPEKRKVSSSNFKQEEYEEMLGLWDENAVSVHVIFAARRRQ